jgi:WD40 repeat protein
VTSNGTLTLWPSNQVIKAPWGDVYNAVLNSAGNRLALLGRAGIIRVLKIPSNDLLPFRARHREICYDAVFARKGTALITGSYDRSAICWDLESSGEIGMSMEHNAGVLSVSESPDTKIIATGSLDRTVKLWSGLNFSALKKNHVLYHPEPVVYVRFISNNELVSHCSDGTTYLWDIPENDQSSRELNHCLGIPDKKKIELPGARLIARNNQVIGSIGSHSIAITLNAPVETIALNPAHTLIAAGTLDQSFDHQSVSLFTSSGVDTGVRLPHSDGITFVVFSHAGDRIATCSEDFSARLWDLNGKPLSAPLRHRNQVRWAAFSQDDEWLATVSWDETLILWATDNGLPVTAPIGTGHTLEWVSFKTDYDLLVGNALKSYRVHLPSQSIDPSQILSEIPTSPELLELP